MMMRINDTKISFGLLLCVACACLLLLPLQIDGFQITVQPHSSLASRRYPSSSFVLHATTDNNDASSSSSTLTDWVVEGLESDGSQITSSSTTKAGENDTLPETGLVIAPFLILAADAPEPPQDDDTLLFPIRLLLGRNGWGTGVHPTTRLCLDWLSSTIQPEDAPTVLDYGCGSGILSMAALHLGATKTIGVDVEAEALITAERNMEENGFGNYRFEGLHTREVLPYGITPSADVCVANILIGQLCRPSMIAALVTNIKPGGLLCLSGIRPNQVDALKAAYAEHVDEWMDYGELNASDTECSVESYGFDVGSWARVVGRIKRDENADDEIQRMSELAVS